MAKTGPSRSRPLILRLLTALARAYIITRSPAQGSAYRTLVAMAKTGPSRPRPLILRSLTAPARAQEDFSLLIYVMVAAVLVLLDFGIKTWVRVHIPLGDSQSLIPGVIDLTHIRNTGAAFRCLKVSSGFFTLLRFWRLLLLPCCGAIVCISRFIGWG